MPRQSEIHRKTKETDIHMTLNLDGTGQALISTGIPFMDHMLTLLGGHGFVDLQANATGNTVVDNHHTVEDLGICLGAALSKALGEKGGISRYGEATVPMDEALARVVVDVSNRPFLSYRVPLGNTMTGTFDVGLVKEFFRALAHQAGITIHVDLLAGDEPHHVAEAIFKAFAKALDRAIQPEKRLKGKVPSTKGVL